MKALLRHWPILLLALWFVGMTVLLDRAVALFGKRTSADPANPTATAPWHDYRLFVDPDSYVWLSYARDLRESTHFRVRFTHMDNAPFGRPVHWSQLPVWGLCAIAFLLETFGHPSPGALELAGRILLPLLGFLSFSVLWLFLRHRISPPFAALAALSPATLLFGDFYPLRFDHHGFQLVVGAAFSLPLLFSSFGFAPPTRKNHLPFVLSGLFGGVALWIGATVFCFTLAAAAIAAAVALIPRRISGDSPQDSAVWRIWGFSGAVTSLFFWLLEYAPNHFSMRLEANHPLYALSFLGIGETLFLLARLRHTPGFHLSPAFLAHAALALAAAATLPVLVLFGPAVWYIPRSTLMLRLHARHIHEFMPLLLFAGNGIRFAVALLAAVGPGIAALVLLLAHIGRRASRTPLPRRVFFALPYFALFLAFFLWQFRWEHFAVWASLLAVLAVAGDNTVFPSRIRLLLAFLLAAQMGVSLWRQCSLLPSFLQGAKTDALCLRAFQYRAAAIQFREALSSPSVTPTPNASAPLVLAPAEFAPFLWYFARIPSLASFYWENLPGNAAAAEAFADSSPDASVARAIVANRRVSHLFMLEGPQDALLFDDLHNGIHSQPHAAHTLAGILSGAIPGTPLPPWLAVDPALNHLANPILYTFLPPQNLWAPTRFPLRIYSLMP